MSDRFCGTIEELKKAVEDTGISGDWKDESIIRTSSNNNEYISVKYRFRGENREVLNWWDRTKTLSFQGKNKENFRENLLPLLEKSKATLDKFLS